MSEGKERNQATGGRAEGPVVIKKYANRRLYNTATSNYVTLDHLSQMVKNGVEFTVQDAKTGEDLTRSVLTQIIVEEEAKGESLLPISFLRQLIGFYGDSLQGLLPGYLEHSMSAFARNQEQMRHYIDETMGEMMPFARFEEMGRENLALFENAVRMFSPFGGTPGPNGAARPAAGAAPGDQRGGQPGGGRTGETATEAAATDKGAGGATPAKPGTGEGKGAKEIDDLRSQLDRLQRTVDAMNQRQR